MLPTRIQITHMKTNTIGTGSLDDIDLIIVPNHCSTIKRNNGFGDKMPMA